MDREKNSFKINTLNYELYFENGVQAERKEKMYGKPFEYLNQYIYAIQDLDNSSESDNLRSEIIWQLWWQGKENMPNLVQTCTESVRKNNETYDVLLITKENYSDYITIPDYIIEKFELGTIPIAQFSDIIRLTLLEKYGGVWIDATVLETGKLPEETFTLDFFTYKNTLGLCFKKVMDFKSLEIMCNYLNYPIMLPATWFISSAPNHIIISGWLKLLLEYWKHENTLKDYFIMDYFFTLLLLNNQCCRDIFTKMPTYLTTNAEVLQSAMPETYNPETFEAIKSFSPIHKLTLNYTPDSSIADRFYNRIISTSR